MRGSNVEALSNGRMLAKLILGEGRRIHPGLELQTQEKFDTLCAKSFKMGASLEQIKHDANAIAEMWEILPDGAKTRENDLHFRLIAAMPISDKRIKEERLKLHLELRTAQAQGKSPPWTIKQLVEVIAVQIGGGLDLPAPGKPGGREAHAGEERSWEGKCPRCGQTGHSWRDCTIRCSECQQKDCPGAHDKPCILKYSTWPTGKINNALGNPLPRQVQDRLHA